MFGFSFSRQSEFSVVNMRNRGLNDMSYLFLRFPGFKRKAVTLSYDDCVPRDRDLIEIINKYGLKCTFNVNSGLFGKGGHLSAEEVKSLYIPSGHEINVHGCGHITLSEFKSPQIIDEIFTDRKNLESLVGENIIGMAYANNVKDFDRIIPVLKTCGIKYARTIECTGEFDLPTDWMRIKPTCSDFSADLFELTEKFIEDKVPDYYWDNTPRWFLMYGHSRFTYENGNASKFERCLERLGGRDDVWYATASETFRYAEAYDRLEFSADGSRVFNPTSTDVYVDYYGEEIVVKSGKTYSLNVRRIP